MRRKIKNLNTKLLIRVYLQIILMHLALAVDAFSWSGSWGVWDWLWLLCGVARIGRGLASVFQWFSASTGKAFILVGDWAVGYHSMEFRHFLSCSATREATCKCHVYK